MAMFPQLLATTHFTLTTATMQTVVAATIQDFFTSVFMNPGQHVPTLMIMCGVTIAACIGLAFLVMKVYEKFFLDK